MDRHLPPHVPSGAPIAVPLGTDTPTEGQAPSESPPDDRSEGLAASPLAPYLDDAVPTPQQRVRDLLAVMTARPRLALQVAIAAAGALGVALLGIVVLSSGGPPVDPDLPFAPAAANSPTVGAQGEQGADPEPAPEPAPGAGAGLGDSGSTAPGEPGEDQPITAHVAGAVVDPGVVVLASDARAHELIEAAGGPRPDADLDRVNLAAPVPDGSRLYVPAVGEEAPPEVVATGGSAGTEAGPDAADHTARVALNSATAAELEALPGVGPAIAEAIVVHRESQGSFASVEELEAVRGIGPAKLEALREHATL